MIGLVILAELLKYRHSFVLGIAVGFPLVFVALQILDFGLRKSHYLYYDRWTWYWFSESGRATWGILVLPILVAVFSALTCWMENEQDNWKLILVQPLAKTDVYVAKLLISLGLVGVAQSILAIGTLVSGVVLGFPGEIPMARVLMFNLAGIVAAFPILTLQLWISTRFQSFFAPIGIAIAGNYLGFLELGSRVQLLGLYNPWTFTTVILGANRQESLDVSYLAVGLLLGGVFVLTGMLDFSRREIF